MKKRITPLLAAGLVSIALGTAGCSSSPEKISAAYVSPIQYSPYDCDQIGVELIRVNRRVVEVSGVQKKNADRDAVAMGVGLVLFWPALFFLAGSDQSEELARLKGEYEALETAAIQKKCDIASQLQLAREQRERARELAEKEQSEQQKGLLD